jgi:micrococcal nuclease
VSRFFYAARVVKVVDGDTLDVVIDLGFDIHHKARVRLVGINTPESRTKDLEEKALGMAAKHYVEDWCLGCGKDVFIKTEKDATGKYGRILARIYADENQQVCLNDQLIDAGHATEYWGGARS